MTTEEQSNMLDEIFTRLREDERKTSEVWPRVERSEKSGRSIFIPHPP